MSKRIKVIVSVLAAILLLTVATTATAMAQEEPKPTPEVGATNGLLARVAEILGISEEDLLNAFKQAQQEMRQEAFTKALDKAVEKGLITQEEADKIKEWWEQKPEAVDRFQSRRAWGFPALGNHLLPKNRAGLGLRLPKPASVG